MLLIATTSATKHAASFGYGVVPLSPRRRHDPIPPHRSPESHSVKIFLTGPWWDTGSWTEYVAAGFTQLGHDVRTFIYSRELNHRPGFRERLRRSAGAGNRRP